VQIQHMNGLKIIRHVKQSCDKKDDTQTVECTVTPATTDATCTEAGKVVYTATCTFKGKEYTCPEKKETTIAATGHKYGEPTFNWSEDGKECTATFTCENDKTHTKDVKCTVTKDAEKSTDATCTEAGKAVYVATVKEDPNGSDEYTDTKEVKTTNALGHDYGEPTFGEWTEKDGKMTCEATFTCKNDASHVETVSCEVTSEGKDATYTEAGSVTYTATATVPEGTKTYINPVKKEVKVAQKDSKAKFAKTSYNLYSTQSGKVSLVSDYKQDGIVSIKSSNPSKVSVNTAGVIKAGVVKGKAVKVTITAVVKSGKTIKTVVTVAPTKITLNATSVPLQLKKSTSVIKVAKATLPGDQIASWSTSNKKVVIVSKSGKITAKKVGTAVVRITMKSGATAKCKVKVQKAAVKLTKIAVNSKKVNLNLKKGPKTYKLTATKAPITVVNKVTFTTSNKKVAVVSKSGKITAKKAGKAVITVKCAKKVQKVTVVVKAK